jgi:cysteine desulfurase
MFHGGSQEFGIRAGTGNPAIAAALAKAVKTAVKNQKENFEKVAKLQKILLDELRKIKNIIINSPENNSPFIVNFSVLKHKSETILRALSAKEIYISTISACSAKKTAESYVIKAIVNNNRPNYAMSSLRVSLSAETKENEILIFVNELKDILEKL